MDDWAPVPPIPNKTNEETTAPNPPASAAVANVGGSPQITFNRPASAGDGDLPVHYRIYRDSSSSVNLYYENMVMEWWDLDSSQGSFSFDDTTASGGPLYYAVVSYDDWNNEAVSTVGPITVSSTEYIIETRTGGLNVSDYSEPAGSFTDSISHSAAPGCSSGIGSRFATPGTDGSSRGDKCRFTPSGLATGSYYVYVTSFNYSSANAQDITLRIYDNGGTSTSQFDLVYTNTGDTWYEVGTINFTSGQGTLH